MRRPVKKVVCSYLRAFLREPRFTTMALARCRLELALILLALITVWANDAAELDMAAELDVTAELIGLQGGRLSCDRHDLLLHDSAACGLG